MAFTHAKSIDAEPQVRSEIGAVTAVAHAGVPSDDLFNRPPPDGTIVVDGSGSGAGLYARVNGTWGALQRENTLDVRAFGAVGDGVTDDTAAIQAAIDKAVADGGGSVEMPAGKTFAIGSTLDLSDARNLELRGSAGGSSMSGNVTTTLLYTGTDDPAIDLASSQGVRLSGLNIRYTNAGFSGTLVATGHSASASDPAYITIEHCYLAGTLGTATSAAALLNLNRTIIASVRDTQFRYADRAIIGRDGSYSNVVTLARCTFFDTAMAPVHNPGQTWTILNCTFEPLSDNTAGAVSHDASIFSRGLVYTGNWHGDVTASGGSWLDLLTLGAVISGNYFGDETGTQPAIFLRDGTQGVVVSGNRFETHFGISVPVATVFGVSITGNDFQTGSSAVTGLANTANACVLGNVGTDNRIGGSKLGFFDTAPVAQPSLPAAGVVDADDIRQALIDLGLCS